MPEEWPYVYGYTQWVEQVWINLINNALKYGGNPPEIRIGYTRESPSSVRFWIKDNGKGLPPASLQKLFNDFERLGNKDTDGTGLGLSIVKRLINKMGGVISVESTNQPGEGCTFSFTLMSEKK
jgi:signal transduction histidine kinase